MSGSEKHQMMYDEASGKVSLLIKSIGPGDEGEYTCTALNPYGEAICTVYISPEATNKQVKKSRSGAKLHKSKSGHDQQMMVQQQQQVAEQQQQQQQQISQQSMQRSVQQQQQQSFQQSFQRKFIFKNLFSVLTHQFSCRIQLLHDIKPAIVSTTASF